MINTQIIKDKNKAIAVILDYKEFKSLQSKAEDYDDYMSAVKTKKSNQKWISHEEVKSLLLND